MSSPTTSVPEDRRKELISQLDSIDFSYTSFPKLMFNPDELEKLVDFVESYGDRRELEGRNKLLNDLTSKADSEYSRQEVDNWTFSLGALTRDAYWESQKEKNNG